jgi:hypothetical protein
MTKGSTSSDSSRPMMYQNLVNHKRGNVDAAAQARRASWDEQKPAPGFIGTMWNKFTRG